MNLISTVVVRWLINSKAISPSDKENYEYAVFCFLITVTPLILVVIIGAFLNIFLESVLFILPFMLLRKFSGGFHLNSMWHCLIFSTFLLSAFLGLIRVLVKFDIDIILTIFLFISTVSLIKFSPIDSKERKLSEKEKIIFKKVTIIIAAIIFLVYLLFLINGVRFVAVPIGLGVLLTAILQIPCIVKQIGKRKHSN